MMDELLTTREMTEADRLAIAAGISSLALMERAGRAVADVVSQRFASYRPLVVLCGPGNNGGDGYIAARILRERGWPVEVRSLVDRSRLSGDAAIAAGRYTGPVSPLMPVLPAEAIVIDALFGAGLSRPIEGEVAEVLSAIGRSGCPVVAVDLPSGINGDTGAAMGPVLQATLTVTFFRKKPGHVLLPGRGFSGAVVVADIGIPEPVLATIKPKVSLNRSSLWKQMFPIPKAADHKYNRGHTLVVSGGISSTGAARMAARAALRAGSGLVTIASSTDALMVNAAASLAVMVRESDGPEGLAALLTDRRINTIILGPGGGVGQEMRAKVVAAAASNRTMILDADALTSFGENPAELFTILSNHKLSTAILTPHDGEFESIFNQIYKNPSVKQKLDKVRRASHETGAIILLKGADSVVCSPDGRCCIADNAPPFLATAGSGDVLAGFIGGLCAQGMPGFEATAAAVWLHGEAAREFGPGLIAEDLPEALPAVYRRLYSDLGVAP